MAEELDLPAYRSRLDRVMAERGAWPEGSPWVREAVAALPRDGFAPERLWRWGRRAWEPVDRAVDPAGWAGELYRSPDEAAVTQLGDGLPTSSLSCQAVVADMADSLRLEPGHRVLELGTGSGWNAALLAHRAGPGRVVGVEADPVLAAAADVRLAAAGLEVQVRTGDGDLGVPDEFPFDRVIATYAVEEIPWAWVEQTAPGGRIVTPWGRLGHVALTVAEDGRSATGWMQGLARFMPTRTQHAHRRRTFGEVRGSVETDRSGSTDRDPTQLADLWGLGFALRVALPDLSVHTGHDADGTSAWITDGHTSWAVLSARTAGGAWTAEGGPRHLAEAVEAAWSQWEAAGCPGVHDYGLTRTPTEQFVWANDPRTGPRWPAAVRRPGDRHDLTPM
ncbi:methyltransferase domain-containing protein [Kitasatospora griseola]|uniref:methyltransferase domain-containing protein n=1 Tax=Kitasatospora griseola TaxID=2064 RepID=UPI000AD27845|nr:methyltransferase domain-containing protein [Kitasatospora griseola]